MDFAIALREALATLTVGTLARTSP
jgi:hypothetical protein